MRSNQYKYQIWNSNWYKKNNTQTSLDWKQSVSNDSEKPIEPKSKAKKKDIFAQTFFPWWRQSR